MGESVSENIQQHVKAFSFLPPSSKEITKNTSSIFNYNTELMVEDNTHNIVLERKDTELFFCK